MTRAFFQLHPGRDSGLGALRLFVEPILTGDDTVDPLYLVALTEIATNALEANARAGTQRPIEVVMDLERRVVVVEDAGGGFDPQIPARVEPLAERGRGLLLANTICPDLAIERTTTGCRTELPYPGSSTRSSPHRP